MSLAKTWMLPLRAKLLNRSLRTPEDSKTLQNRVLSTCGVCGDDAKHIHFGGLCCSSCKAFFRRVVQTKIQESLTCDLKGSCKITVKNKRACSACRFRKCEEIGMMSSWVMSDENRKILNERRKEASKRIQDRMTYERQRQVEKYRPTIVKTNDDVVKLAKITNADDDDDDVQIEGKREKDLDADAEPEVMKRNSKDITHEEFCATEEDKNEKTLIKPEIKIEPEDILDVSYLLPDIPIHLRTTLLESFQNFEFPRELSKTDSNNIDTVITQYYSVLTAFFTSVADLKPVQKVEKSKLTKAAVAKSIFLYSCHQYDSLTKTFPRKRLNSKCLFPTVNLADLESFINNKKFFMDIQIFLSNYSHYLEAEDTVLYLMVLSFLNCDSENVSETVLNLRQRYFQLFKLFITTAEDSESFQPYDTYMQVLIDVDKLSRLFGELVLPSFAENHSNEIWGVKNDLQSYDQIKTEPATSEEDHNPNHHSKMVGAEDPIVIFNDHNYSNIFADIHREKVFWKQSYEISDTPKRLARPVGEVSRSTCCKREFYQEHLSARHSAPPIHRFQEHRHFCKVPYHSRAVYKRHRAGYGREAASEFRQHMSHHIRLPIHEDMSEHTISDHHADRLALPFGPSYMCHPQSLHGSRCEPETALNPPVENFHSHFLHPRCSHGPADHKCRHMPWHRSESKFIHD